MRSQGNNLNLKINNLSVSYTDEGPDDAPVILFIHGFPFNKNMWTKQIEVLKNNYRVIAYDIRGHGKSDLGNVDFSIELFVTDLIGFMNTLRIDKTILCGLSMGGYIAQQAIEKYKDRFLGLILCDTQCMADTPEAKAKRLQAIETLEANIELYAKGSIQNLFAPESLVTKKIEVEAVKGMILNTSKKTLSQTLLALSVRKETCSELHKISVPTLILVGKEDKITPLAAAYLMHEKIKDSSLMVIADAGHLSNLENPTEFNYQLEKFMLQFRDASHQNA